MSIATIHFRYDENGGTIGDQLRSVFDPLSLDGSKLLFFTEVADDDDESKPVGFLLTNESTPEIEPYLNPVPELSLDKFPLFLLSLPFIPDAEAFCGDWFHQYVPANKKITGWDIRASFSGIEIQKLSAYFVTGPVVPKKDAS